MNINRKRLDERVTHIHTYSRSLVVSFQTNKSFIKTMIASCTLILLLIIIVQCASIRVCSDRLNSVLGGVCTFPNEKTPCFKGAYFNGVAGRGKLFIRYMNIDIIDQRQREISTTDGIATKCCTEGCNYDYMRKFCCFTYKCLRHCYPKSNYTEKDGIIIV